MGSRPVATFSPKEGLSFGGLGFSAGLGVGVFGLGVWVSGFVWEAGSVGIGDRICN